MTPREALAFVEKRGIVLESARGPVPSLAETIAGEPIRGSWWGHPKGDSIFACSRTIRNSKDVLTCRLIHGNVTYVHRRFWPALVRLSDKLGADRLAPIKEVHTAAGKHRIDSVPFSRWVLPRERRQGGKLSAEEAIAQLQAAGMTKLGSTK
jgi:hypothetical protein